MLLAGVHGALVGGARLGRFGIFSGRGESGDGLPGGGPVCQWRSGLGQGLRSSARAGRVVPGLVCGLVVLGLEICQELDDIYAASSRASRRVGAGVVRRRVMFTMEAQEAREVEVAGR